MKLLKIKSLVLVIILFSINSCKKENKPKFQEGIYCLQGYIDKNNFESDYIETFLIKITKDDIIRYGTVNTWGFSSKRNFENEEISILNDSTIIDSTIIDFGDTGIKSKFIKLKDADKIIDEKGINRKEFVKYLNKNLIAGSYKLNDKVIQFRENGTIENLDSLKTFSIAPRFGTLWWYDYRTIEINNQMWKFDFTKEHLILTKYLPRDKAKETQAVLSGFKIILDR